MMRKYTKKQRGATMVEYAFMLVLIAIVAIIGVTNLGSSISNLFSAAVTFISNG